MENNPKTNTGTKVKNNNNVKILFFIFIVSALLQVSFYHFILMNARFFKYEYILSQKYFFTYNKMQAPRTFYCQKKNSPHIFYVKTVLTVHVPLLRNFAPVKFQNDFE